MFFLNYIWLVPLLPAFGAAIMFFFGRKLQKATVSAVCVGAVALICAALPGFIAYRASAAPPESACPETAGPPI